MDTSIPDRIRASAFVVALAVPAFLACVVPVQAQSVQPNRYSPAASPKVSDDALYRRQQQASQEAANRQHETARRIERDRIDQMIADNDQAQEADRVRTEHRRATADTPAESGRLRQEHQQRRQASELQRQELERQRSQAEKRP